MKKSLLIFLLFPVFRIALAQEPYILIDTINIGERAGFTTDYLGQIYVFDGGDLIKFDKNGKQLGIYSTRDYGDIGYVDASNPLKTLVVYPDFSKAILLDGSLSANAVIDLAKPGMVPVILICTSRDEGFWIFDESSRRVKKVDMQLNVIADGTDLAGIAENLLKPDHLQESSQWLFLHDQESGILIFDRYGTYYKTFRELNISNFQSDGNNLIYLNAGEVVALDVRTMAKTTYILPSDVKGKAARIAPERIYLLAGNEIRIYSF